MEGLEFASLTVFLNFRGVYALRLYVFQSPKEGYERSGGSEGRAGLVVGVGLGQMPAADHQH